MNEKMIERTEYKLHFEFGNVVIVYKKSAIQNANVKNKFAIRIKRRYIIENKKNKN